MATTNNVRGISLTLSCILLSAISTIAQPKPTSKPDTSKHGDEKPFADVVKDYKEIPGLFTLFVKEDENKMLMEIKPDQIDKVFLCSFTREAGDGRYYDGGAMLENFPFIFKRVGKKIQLLHKNVYFRADSTSPISRAIPRGVTNSFLGSAKIESMPHPERGSILIDPSSMFLQDFAFVTGELQEAFKVDFNFDKENSYYSGFKSFPKNTEIEVTLTYTTNKPKPGFGPIADTRSIQHKYHYSLSVLPETGYRPRLADDRVGHFLTMYQDYTKGTEDSPYRRYINRWHLVKANPNEQLSPPEEPIVYWLENTIPLEYRKAVSDGVLLWNKAFERIGYKDAIVVKQQPDSSDWDPADVRYHTIRWIVIPGGGYAVGPSLTNPFTGEIYDADIRVSSDITRFIVKDYEEFVNPLTMANKMKTSELTANQYSCNYGEGAVREAAFGWSLLEARGLLDENDSLAKKFVNDYLIGLIAHEVGHTLGLRHNFRASSIHTTSELQNNGLTMSDGITGSVMDYIPVNLASDPARQGQYWQTTLGPYDYWAIEYAYKPINATSPDGELPELEKIASRASDPKLAYGTDEDAFGFSPQGIDPVTNVFDLGDDPLAYYRNRIKLVRELWGKMESKLDAKNGLRYQKFRRVFSNGFSEYFLAGLTASKYIGGIYHYRSHVGDPGNHIPYEPVPASKQREALAFLKTNLFGPDAFKFSSSLINKLAIERLYDFEFSLIQVQRVDFPIHDFVLSMQRPPLDRLYNPITLGRLVDIESRYSKQQEKFTMSEMFRGIRESIWSELTSGNNINGFRRGLQRAHLAKLIELLLKPQSGTPEDARTLARSDLLAIQKGAASSMKSKLDDMTRAHLDETRARIDAALKESLQAQVVTQ